MDKEQKKIIQLLYTGETDEDGRPHGEGVLRYVVEPDLEKIAKDPIYKGYGDLRYRGRFEHGLRQGEGDLHALGLHPNPVSEYEWFSEGEYDCCGRLTHPSHEPGSYQRNVQMWYPYFEGTWENDMPLKSRWGNEISDLGMSWILTTRKTEIERDFDFTFFPEDVVKDDNE